MIVAAGLIAVRRSSAAPIAALRGLDLTVGPGEIAAIVGPSGSGKTTLLDLLAGRSRPTAGTLVVGGLDLVGAPDRAVRRFRRSAIGIVDQRYRGSLSPYVTIRDTIERPLAVRGVPTIERRHRADMLLEAIGLGDRRAARPGDLSGGEQQRVAVAAALAHRPAILLADEPTAELDVVTAAALLRLIAELVRAEPATAVIATHDARIEEIADRTVVVRDGRAIEERRGPLAGPGRRLVDGLGWLAPQPGHAGPALDTARPADPHRPTVAAPRDPPAIRLDAVTRMYGRGLRRQRGVARLSASVPTGGLHVVVGPSGSGKSTTLRLVAGLDRPDDGRVVVLGADLATLDRDALARLRASSIGLVEQDVGLLPFLSVRENIELAASIRRAGLGGHGVPGTDDGIDGIDDILRELGLEGLADRRPTALSAGERTRAAIARALVGRPAILLLDEPTATLDRATAGRTAALLLELGAGRTVLVATHDPAIVGPAATRIEVDRETSVEPMGQRRRGDVVASGARLRPGRRDRDGGR